ncbi:MAG: 2Fe-2S iron-sulfur cluster binding domain-containing protein, partial [Burkholderiales bacterium]|nr:2Fe-2S iron-sulfur cluster binding domain-containing protein [Burkholderiales bacterium]
MPKVTIRPDNISFDAKDEESILATALQHNFNLPHGCKNGLCGACKCKVTSGNILLDEYNKIVLSDEEINQGYTLLCKAHPINDVELFIPELLNGFPIKIIPAKVISVKKINNIAIVKMKTPQNQKFGFYAGQYIDIIVNGKNRSYSIANACYDNGEVEAHVKYHSGGVFSEFVWNRLKEGDILRFKGPLGNFKLRKSDNPVIFVCTGTGFAPVKSFLEEYAKEHTYREMYLYWGNREVKDFYL